MLSTGRLGHTLRVSELCTRTLLVAAVGVELRPSASQVKFVWRSLNVSAAAETNSLKGIDDLPGPSISNDLYMLLFKGYLNKIHLLQSVYKNLYGPIWRSKVGSYMMINVASPALIAQVLQQEGRYPVRFEMKHWRDYREMRGQALGLHASDATDWHQLRRTLNPGLLKQKEVAAFAPTVHQVVGDLLKRIEFLRSCSQDQATVSNIASELYKFGFEATSAILFETRLGCLEQNIPKDTMRFITAVNDMLTLSQLIVLFPRWSWSVLPIWKRFVKAWDDLYDVAEKLIDRRVAEIVNQVQRGEPTESMYLTKLLSSDQMSRADVNVTVTELLLGGVDTTSNTLTWALYHLSRDHRVQNQLYMEVSSVCPDRQVPATDDLSKMPYLKAVIKETLRLYPVVPGNARLITENDVIVDKYWFPKKTLFHLCHYAISHDETVFTDAESFVPERWLRTKTPLMAAGTYGPDSCKHQPYSFIPFGVGLRGCVGKRLAEMELYFTLSRLMQLYTVIPEDATTTINPITRTLLVPEEPVNLRFQLRDPGASV
ncbi:sterol 26-hydroxylase, mitochondrial [Cynoglossus semilaevis]|uniref:Cytochrome P450 family 27 subfamily A member 2 n=1 Tax=Cynoglossus semilaevis TaxID=244447 RepID=A0A3P8V713_CYNSE|nr:sterol 26-hydroxylase, mitochondrial-like [Cynoglossus semilaevis]